jgi:hypothetical protein
MLVHSFAPARASLVWLAPALIFVATARPESPSTGPAIDYDQKANRFAVTRLDAKALADFAAGRPTPEAWRSLFFIAVAGSPGELVPMLGEYKAENGVLLFTPRFPPASGDFIARLDPSRLPGAGGAAAVEKRFRFERKPAGPPATVAQVYPTADALPENLLRLYVHFTGPMRRGEAYDHVRILDAAGKEVVTPFLTLGQELWDPDGRRLTLLLDPGRVKHGLKPREELGPILEAGKQYTLVIDGRWRDAEGRPLGRDYRKAIRAVAGEVRPIEPGAWGLHPPAAGTRAPLTVTLQRPLDHALLQRVLHVVDANGRAVEGEVAVTESEKRWQFTPSQPWAVGQYNLEVEPVLEDPSGNRVGRAFEVDEERPVPTPADTVRRPFTVSAKQ